MSLLNARNYVSNMVTMCVVSISLSTGGRSVDKISLSLNALSRGELSRILVSQFYFKTWPQLLLGLIVIRTFAVFEKQMGTRKFGSFVIISWGMCILQQIALAVLGATVGLQIVPEPGPFFFIFSLLPLYHRYIPKVSPSQYQVLGLNISEKTWIYVLTLQLCLSDGISSTASSLCGLVAGLAYLSDGSPLQNFRLPSMVERGFTLAANFFDSMFSNPPTPPGGDQSPTFGSGPAGPRRNISDNSHQLHQRRPTGDGAAAGMAGPTDFAMREPSDENITTLMGLGFDRSACVSALRSTGNDVEAAADRLFSSMR